jgi:hypothetical protein
MESKSQPLTIKGGGQPTAELLGFLAEVLLSLPPKDATVSVKKLEKPDIELDDCTLA